MMYIYSQNNTIGTVSDVTHFYAACSIFEINCCDFGYNIIFDIM